MYKKEGFFKDHCAEHCDPFITVYKDCYACNQSNFCCKCLQKHDKCKCKQVHTCVECQRDNNYFRYPYLRRSSVEKQSFGEFNYDELRALLPILEETGKATINGSLITRSIEIDSTICITKIDGATKKTRAADAFYHIGHRFVFQYFVDMIVRHFELLKCIDVITLSKYQDVFTSDERSYLPSVIGGFIVQNSTCPYFLIQASFKDWREFDNFQEFQTFVAKY